MAYAVFRKPYHSPSHWKRPSLSLSCSFENLHTCPALGLMTHFSLQSCVLYSLCQLTALASVSEGFQAPDLMGVSLQGAISDIFRGFENRTHLYLPHSNPQQLYTSEEKTHVDYGRCAVLLDVAWNVLSTVNRDKIFSQFLPLFPVARKRQDPAGIRDSKGNVAFLTQYCSTVFGCNTDLGAVWNGERVHSWLQGPQPLICVELVLLSTCIRDRSQCLSGD